MKRATLFMAVAAAALLSVGCSIQKRCQAPDLNLPETIVEGAVDSLTMADMDWWEVYADSTLCDLIRRTLDRNKDMLTAEANVRRMAELYRIDKTALLPSMSGLVFGDRETNAYYGEKSSVDPELSVKATISWEADLWGNLRWAKRRALAEYLASVEGARAMRMTLIAQVATAYFELVALDQELDIVRRTVAAREESLAQAQLRFEGGVTSEIPYQQAKVELARSAAMIPDLEMEITQKENEISLLAGGYPSTVERADSLDAALPEGSGVGLPSTLLQRRPDIREAEESLRAAMADVGMAGPFPASAVYGHGRCRERCPAGVDLVSVLISVGTAGRADILVRGQAREVSCGYGGIRCVASGLRAEGADGIPRGERCHRGISQREPLGRTETQSARGVAQVCRADAAAIHLGRYTIYRLSGCRT